MRIQNATMAQPHRPTAAKSFMTAGSFFGYGFREKITVIFSRKRVRIPGITGSWFFSVKARERLTGVRRKLGLVF